MKITKINRAGKHGYLLKATSYFNTSQLTRIGEYNADLYYKSTSF